MLVLSSVCVCLSRNLLSKDILPIIILFNITVEVFSGSVMQPRNLASAITADSGGRSDWLKRLVFVFDPDHVSICFVTLPFTVCHAKPSEKRAKPSDKDKDLME